MKFSYWKGLRSDQSSAFLDCSAPWHNCLVPHNLRQARLDEPLKDKGWLFEEARSLGAVPSLYVCARATVRVCVILTIYATRLERFMSALRAYTSFTRLFFSNSLENC
jgi:hypothetical protein